MPFVHTALRKNRKRASLMIGVRSMSKRGMQISVLAKFNEDKTDPCKI